MLPEFDLEQSLDKDDAITTLHRLYPEHGAVAVADEYFDERAHVIDEIMGGRFSFQVRETRMQENKNKILESLNYDRALLELVLKRKFVVLLDV